MNERIRELVDQSRKYFPKTESSGEYWVFDEEKFAELIVRECARVASDYDGAHYVGTDIEQHFGVEE